MKTDDNDDGKGKILEIKKVEADYENQNVSKVQINLPKMGPETQ